jgi:hypothetical protein
MIRRRFTVHQNRTIQISALTIFLLITQVTFAQEGFKGFLKNKEGFKLEPFAQFQLWSVYSSNQKVFNAQSKAYERVDNRLNFLLRRTRIGFRMQPYDNLKATVIFSFDAIGRDVQSGVFGIGNNGAIPAVGIFDAFLEWRLKPGSEKLILVAGYFRPQISRESITPAWQVGSFEKSATQNYLRQHLIGVNSGRSTGVNLGGLFKGPTEKVYLNYNVGIFNPGFYYNNNNSVGTQFSPLLVARAVLSLGDPELKQYSISYIQNYYNLRKGVSLALNGSIQGSTDLFRQNASIGADVLLNWRKINLDAEYHHLLRSGSRELPNNSGTRTFDYKASVEHIRVGYNWIAGKKLFLEPTFTLMHFQGATTALSQADASAVRSSSGAETSYDAGINWHLQERRLKLLLHYTWRQGDPGAAGDGATVNDYFTQANVGAIRRGNWLGLGLNAIF